LFRLCQYNRQLLPPEFILNVIRTHPTVIYRGVVCRNMYHVPPDEFLATNQTAREVERLLTTIRERAELEYTLRQQRNELRSLANRLMHAQDDERRRIATMLHETTAQDLAALKNAPRAIEPNRRPSQRRRTAGAHREHLAGRAVDDRHPNGVLPAASAISRRGRAVVGTPVVRRRICRAQRHQGGSGPAEGFERLPLDTETVLFESCRSR